MVSLFVVWFGKDIFGIVVWTDFVCMLYILIVGTMGFGKFGCINMIFMLVFLCVMFDDVWMIFIDFKCIEFSYYELIFYLFVFVVFSFKEVIVVFVNVIVEMECWYE